MAGRAVRTIVSKEKQPAKSPRTDRAANRSIFGNSTALPAWLALLLLCLIVAAVFGRACINDFVSWDDHLNVTENPDLNPATAQTLLEIWAEPRQFLYVPLTYSAWAAMTLIARTDVPDAEGATLDASLYHALNLVVHAISACVVFLILRRLIGATWAKATSPGATSPSALRSASRLNMPNDRLAATRQRSALDQKNASDADERRESEQKIAPDLRSLNWPAFAGAVLFAIHPLQVESVAWVTGLKDALSGMLGLVTIWQYLIFAQVDRAENGTVGLHGPEAVSLPPRRFTARRLGAYVFATIALAGAILAKPSAACVPIIVATIDLLILGRRPWKLLVEMAPWITIAALLIVVNRAAQPAGMVRFVPGLAGRCVVALDALSFYTKKFAIPWPLAIEYGRSPSWLLNDRHAITCWIIPLCLVLLALRYRKRQPQMVAGLAIAVAALLPVLGFVPFQFQNFSTVTDHYAYIALLGPALALTAWLCGSRPNEAASATRPFRARVPFVVGWLTILAVLSIIQIGYWHDSIRLLTHELSVNPASWSAHEELGWLALRSGDASAAEPHFRAALNSQPRMSRLHTQLAKALLTKGALAESAVEFQEAATLDPGDPLPHLGLANALRLNHDAKAACEQFAISLRMRPDDVVGRMHYADTLLEKGDPNAALEQYRIVLRLEPGFAPALAGQQKAQLAVGAHQHSASHE